jgi:hypothetical protein
VSSCREQIVSKGRRTLDHVDLLPARVVLTPRQCLEIAPLVLRSKRLASIDPSAPRFSSTAGPPRSWIPTRVAGIEHRSGRAIVVVYDEGL